MAERRVTQTRKNDEGDIMALCQPGAYWSPRYTDAAIEDINNGTHRHYVQGAAGRSDIHVVTIQTGRICGLILMA